MQIRESARKHGVADDDIRHAVEHPTAREELDAPGDEQRVLWLGPDRAGNLLEIIVVVFEDGAELAVHAMKMRPMYRRVLPKER